MTVVTFVTPKPSGLAICISTPDSVVAVRNVATSVAVTTVASDVDGWTAAVVEEWTAVVSAPVVAVVVTVAAVVAVVVVVMAVVVVVVALVLVTGTSVTVAADICTMMVAAGTAVLASTRGATVFSGFGE